MHGDFPLPDTTWEPAAPFWAAAERHELRIPRCDACGHWQWYPREHCATCRGGAFTWTLTSGRATLFSWVVVTHPFLPQFADEVPFVTGLAELDDAAGVRLATRVVDVDPLAGALHFGQPLEAVYRPLTFTGIERTVTAPFFRPVAAR